ncbi:MAG TPA: LptF/LptG family permease [bacterium]|nr:LptF/LptG family permease [bacterium]
MPRYILSEFLKPFFLALGGFGVIFLLAQVFQELQLLRDFKPPFGTALLYFSYFLPAFLVQVMPLACLFGVLFTLSLFSRGNELMAMRSGGANILSVALPLLFAGALIGTFSLLFNETIVPKAEELKTQVRDVRIKHQPETSFNKIRQNLSLVGADGRLYHIGTFDGAQNTLADFLMLEFGPDGHIRTRVDAKSGSYENGEWIFRTGTQRVFDGNDDEIGSTNFDTLSLALPEDPRDFLKEQREAQQMNYKELSAYIGRLRKNGMDVHKEEVYLFYKFASPFGCVILALLGVPWGWTMRKYTGGVLSFAICLIVGLVYIGGMEIGQHLGESGVVSPFLSVWVVNLIFAAATPLMLLWKNK